MPCRIAGDLFALAGVGERSCLGDRSTGVDRGGRSTKHRRGFGRRFILGIVGNQVRSRLLIDGQRALEIALSQGDQRSRGRTSRGSLACAFYPDLGVRYRLAAYRDVLFEVK